MEAAVLMDLDFSGPPCTWRGIRNEELVEEQINKGLCNLPWLDRWPITAIIHASVVALDHSPFFYSVSAAFIKGKKRFRFEAFWAKEEDCRCLIETCWHSAYHELQMNWGQNAEEIKDKTILLDRLRQQDEFFFATTI
ncbi:hypothetical protein TB2_012681 [Malus domestica]